MQITVLSHTKTIKKYFHSVERIFNWKMFVTARKKKKDHFQGQVQTPQSWLYKY